jgi:hypothetical protein
MEFMSRGNGHPAQQAPQQPTVVHGAVKARRKHIDWVAKTVRFELFIVVVGVTLLLVAVSLWLATGNFTNAQTKQINTKEYQAIFLTNGQVYFGKIGTFNSKFVSLTHVFYIENQNSSTTSTTTTSNNNYTLRKLGVSELHAPEDKMVINSDQVSFWENLKDSSQVVTKIKEYYSNPSAANQQSSSSTGTQGSTNTTTQSTGTSTNSTTSKP